MPVHRFAFISSCICFDDKNTRAGRRQQHGLATIKELWDHFVGNCKKFYSPSANLTIDVQLLAFLRRLIARVYNGKKPENAASEL